MKMKQFFTGCAVAASVALGVGALGGCGTGGGARSANIQAGDMPSGESWDGVYYNPVYGYLHVVQQEGNVVGRWQRTDKSKWGEMSGTATGNVVHYTWKEHTYGLIDPASTRAGKGYFVFKMGANDIPELKGEWGNSEDETGNSWDCVQQKGMKPDLESITGDMKGTAPAAGEHWE